MEYITSANMIVNTSADTALNTNSTSTQDIQYWEHILTAVILQIVAVVGIVGNSMIIVAVAFSCKLQTSTNAFITSLSVADLVTSLSLVWFSVALLDENGWLLPGAEWICQLHGFLIYACRGTSLYTLAAIAVNRLLLIRRPDLYRSIFRSCYMVIWIAIPWVIPGGSFIVLLISGIGAIGYDDKDFGCESIDSHPTSDVYHISVTLIAIPIPLIIIIVSYAWIYVYLKRHYKAKKLKLVTSSPSFSRSNRVINLQGLKNNSGSHQYSPASSGQFGPTFTGQCGPTLSGQHGSSGHCGLASNGPISMKTDEWYTSDASVIHQRRKISQKQVAITKNLFIIVCSIFLCFAPYLIHVFLKETSEVHHIFFYARIITLSNCAINFAINARKHPDFKAVFGHLIRRSYADIPQPSRLLKFLLSVAKKN